MSVHHLCAWIPKGSKKSIRDLLYPESQKSVNSVWVCGCREQNLGLLEDGS